MAASGPFGIGSFQDNSNPHGSGAEPQGEVPAAAAGGGDPGEEQRKRLRAKRTMEESGPPPGFEPTGTPTMFAPGGLPNTGAYNPFSPNGGQGAQDFNNQQVRALIESLTGLFQSMGGSSGKGNGKSGGAFEAY